MIERQLAKSLQYIQSITKVQNRSKIDKSLFELELKAFLLANVPQCQDDIRLKTIFETSLVSHNNWVHTTAAEHVSARYYFAVLLTILGDDEDFLIIPEIRHVVQDYSKRLSVACRMFNDYASLSRDRTEVNLNSGFFLEFEGKNKSDDKVELAALANYKKASVAWSIEQLETVCGCRFHRVYCKLRLFFNVCEILTEIYTVKDRDREL